MSPRTVLSVLFLSVTVMAGPGGAEVNRASIAVPLHHHQELQRLWIRV
jgi:hypothetical protein